MLKYLKFYLLCCLVVMLCSNSVYAESVILNVLTEEIPPYQYYDKQQKQIVGTSTAVVRKTLNCSGYKNTISIYPWNRAYQQASKNKNTLIYSIARLKEREHQFKWIGIIGYTESYLYKLKHRIDIKIEKLDDAKQYHLGLLKDDFVTQVLNNNGFIEHKNYSLYLDAKSKLPMLFDGRYELIEGNPQVMKIQARMQKFNFNELVKMYPIIKKQPLYLAMNIDSDRTIVTKLQKCLQQQL